MGLDVRKLEKVVELDDGVIRARCPACAERGQDETGNHLRVNADGRFGCCVFPGDSEHRRRIFALAGDRSREGIKVRVAAKVSGAVHANILGRLGRVFQSPTANSKGSDASDGVGEVQSTNLESRTPRTGNSNSNGGSEEPPETNVVSCGESRTLRTGIQNSRVQARQMDSEEENRVNILKEFRTPVRSVREGEAAVQPPMELQEGVRGVREQKEEYDSGNGMAAVSHAEGGEQSEEDLERKMNESPY